MSFGRGGSGGFSRGGGFSGSYGRGGDLSRGGTFSRGGVYSKPGGVGGNRPSTLPSRAPGGGARPGQLPSGGRPGGIGAPGRPGGVGGVGGPGGVGGVGGVGKPGGIGGVGGVGGVGGRPGQGNRPGNRPGGGNNIGNGNNINIDNDWGGGWDGYHDYPWGAGLAIGAAAAVTAAAIGSTYYALPYGCPPYPYGGYTYYSCGGAWYQPQYEGDTVVYVTVPDPTGGQTTTTVQR